MARRNQAPAARASGQHLAGIRHRCALYQNLSRNPGLPATTPVEHRLETSLSRTSWISPKNRATDLHGFPRITISEKAQKQKNFFAADFADFADKASLVAKSSARM